MTRTRISLLTALALVVVFQFLSVPVAHAVMTWPDGSTETIAGSGGFARSDPGPTTGEPDVTGNGAPPKVGTSSTSLQRSPLDTPSPAEGLVRMLARIWMAWTPWTWR